MNQTYLSQSSPVRRSRAVFAALITLAVVAACGTSGDGDSTEGADSDGAGQTASGFYAGRSAEILVPVPLGGGTDLVARWVAEHLPAHVEGEPEMYVYNVDTGGAIVGGNEYVLQRESDGETVLFGASTMTFPAILMQEGVVYDFGSLDPVLGVPEGGAFYISPDTGVETIADLAKPDLQLYEGHQSPTAGNAAVRLLAWEVLGIRDKVDFIFGYEGQGPIRVAFEQGETNVDFQTTSAIFNNVQDLVDAGSANLLFTLGHVEDGEVVRDPAFPDLPSVLEVHEELYGESPSGPMWDAYVGMLAAWSGLNKVMLMHSDAPPEALAALREGAASLSDDRETIEAGFADGLLNYDLLVGDQLESAFGVLTGMSDETIDTVISFLVEDYDMEDPRGE